MHLEEARVPCPYCGEMNWIEVDPSESFQQFSIIDCEVCCRPIELSLILDDQGQILQTIASADESV